jgi:diguanylate cyclase (GGDEF)-like protein
MIVTPVSAAPAGRVPLPPDESDRLAALYRYQLLDTPSCDDFTFLTELAARICEVPFAFVTLVDRERVWIKSHCGAPIESIPRDQCYCSLAILGGESTEFVDLSSDPRSTCVQQMAGAPLMRRYASFTLRSSDGYALGTLCVLDIKPGALSADQRHILHRLSRQVMALIELRAKERALETSLRQLQQLAATDELTGLGSRRAWMERLDVEVGRARRYRTPLSAVMIDLDHFKLINDRHGHQAGDAVLRNVGRRVAAGVRASDFAARYGGEELCVLLPATALDGARSLAESLRGALSELVHGTPEQAIGFVSASFGVAELDLSNACENGDALLQRADLALYRAKHLGRDRVVADQAALAAPAASTPSDEFSLKHPIK